MTEVAPAASALTISPEWRIPPSAMTPRPNSRATSAHLITAVSCGTPTPATIRGADRARTNTNLDDVGSRLKERPSTFRGCDIAGHEWQLWIGILGFFHCFQDTLGVSMGSINRDDVHASFYECCDTVYGRRQHPLRHRRGVVQACPSSPLGNSRSSRCL